MQYKSKLGKTLKFSFLTNKLQVKKKEKKKYHEVESVVKVAYQILRGKVSHLTYDIKITGRYLNKQTKITYTEINSKK